MSSCVAALRACRRYDVLVLWASPPINALLVCHRHQKIATLVDEAGVARRLQHVQHHLQVVAARHVCWLLGELQHTRQPLSTLHANPCIQVTIFCAGCWSGAEEELLPTALTGSHPCQSRTGGVQRNWVANMTEGSQQGPHKTAAQTWTWNLSAGFVQVPETAASERQP